MREAETDKAIELIRQVRLSLLELARTQTSRVSSELKNATAKLSEAIDLLIPF